MSPTRCFLLACLFVCSAAGCVTRPAPGTGVLPARIGDTPSVNTAGLDAYETAVVGLLNHMDDAARVLMSVKDVSTAERAARMIDEAAPRVVTLRQAMEDLESERSITEVDFILTYGPRYLGARASVKDELDRIKALGPAIHDPVKAAMRRLESGVKDKGLSTE